MKFKLFFSLSLFLLLACMLSKESMAQPVLKTTETPVLMFAQVNPAHILRVESPLSALKHVDLKETDSRTRASFHQFMKQRQLMEQPVQKLEKSHVFHE